MYEQGGGSRLVLDKKYVRFETDNVISEIDNWKTLYCPSNVIAFRGCIDCLASANAIKQKIEHTPCTHIRLEILMGSRLIWSTLKSIPGTAVQSCENPTNLQTWFGGRFWSNNEEGFVNSDPIPFSWESGNQLMNHFLKTVASLILKPG